MSIYVPSVLSTAYVGSTAINKIYLGSTLIYPVPVWSTTPSWIIPLGSGKHWIGTLTFGNYGSTSENHPRAALDRCGDQYSTSSPTYPIDTSYYQDISDSYGSISATHTRRFWATSNSYANPWMMYQAPVPLRVTKVEVGATYNLTPITNLAVYGSNDGTTFTQLTLTQGSYSNRWCPYTVASSQQSLSFYYLKFVVTSTTYSSVWYHPCLMLNVFGYYPTNKYNGIVYSNYLDLGYPT